MAFKRWGLGKTWEQRFIQKSDSEGEAANLEFLCLAEKEKNNNLNQDIKTECIKTFWMKLCVRSHMSMAETNRKGKMLRLMVLVWNAVKVPLWLWPFNHKIIPVNCTVFTCLFYWFRPYIKKRQKKQKKNNQIIYVTWQNVLNVLKILRIVLYLYFFKIRFVICQHLLLIYCLDLCILLDKKLYLNLWYAWSYVLINVDR